MVSREEKYNNHNRNVCDAITGDQAALFVLTHQECE